MKIQQSMRICITLVILQLCNIHAQNALVSSGGSATSTSGSISYSMGQIDYISASTSNKGSINLGVQQPWSISPISGLKGTEKLTLDCSLFPNPSTDFVVLNWTEAETKTIVYKITDISGKTIMAQATAENKSLIDVKDFASGTFIITLYDAKNNFLKSFKLIKN